MADGGWRMADGGWLGAAAWHNFLLDAGPYVPKEIRIIAPAKKS
jgi:hypothetical protein